MIVTRFAPSPNGPLHLGHAYSAIVAHDLAKAAGRALPAADRGHRRRPLAARAGATSSAPTSPGSGSNGTKCRRNRRALAAYEAAAERLRAMGLLYPCRCTRAEIARGRDGQGPDGPVYPGTCRGASLDAGRGRRLAARRRARRCGAPAR